MIKIIIIILRVLQTARIQKRKERQKPKQSRIIPNVLQLSLQQTREIKIIVIHNRFSVREKLKRWKLIGINMIKVNSYKIPREGSLTGMSLMMNADRLFQNH